MTERGHPDDVALACPFVAFDDERDERSDRPDQRHRCYAESPPSAIALGHQEQFCLSPGFAGCPIFRAWAAREAARVTTPSFAPGSVGFVAAAAADRVIPDVPGRQVQQGAWSQPPPWLTSDGDEEEDDDRLDRLVARRPAPATSAAGGAPAAPIDPSVAAAAPTFLTRPLDRPAGAGLAGSIADESAAAALASRLAAIGMAQAPAAPGGTVGASATPGLPLGAPPADALADGTPVVTSTAPPVDPSAPVRRMASPEDDIIGARVIREPGAGSELSRIIRLGTAAPAPEPRPVSSAGGSRGRGPEPWEQPRRPEAYPTIRTRARVPRIPRAAFGAVALAAAAAFLFFVVPPLFVNDGAGGPGASGSARPGASATVRPSRTPARSAAPSPRVYVVRSGDTLSTIAQRFGVTVDEILEANPEIKNPNQIGAGDRIVIPATASATPDAEESPTEEPAGT